MPIDNKGCSQKGKLTMPVLAIGGDHSYGAPIADRDAALPPPTFAAGSIKDSGHWIMEEQPAQAIALITSFLGK